MDGIILPGFPDRLTTKNPGLDATVSSVLASEL
jgi:hypothetical protein